MYCIYVDDGKFLLKLKKNKEKCLRYYYLSYLSYSHILVQVQTAHGRGVPVEREHTLPRLRVPDPEAPVCAARHNDVVAHLAAPHPARVPDQRPHALPWGKGLWLSY